MKFHLSGRQRKEIEVRATGLLIAVPVPLDPVADELTYVRGRLAVPPEWIRSVQRGEIDVDVSSRAGEAGLFPAIVVPGRVFADRLTLRVVVFAVALAAGDRRRTSAKIQWPGGAIELPGGAAAGDA